MGVYDQAARYLVKRNPAGFFQWRVPRFTANFLFHGWLDTSRLAFPGEPDRICDTVAEFTPANELGPRRILDVEFQSRPDVDMLERLGEYAYRLRRELRYGEGLPGKYQVACLLLNLTGPMQTDFLDMREADLDEAGFYVRAVVGTLHLEDAAETLARIAAGQLQRCVLPWIPPLQGADAAAIMEEWKRLATQEPDGSFRADYGGLALVFAELATCSAAWQRALEGWNVEESQQVLAWQEKARREGKLEYARASLLRALQLRFRVQVPADLTRAIEQITSLDEMSRWFDASQTADSLEAFRAAVQHGERV
jgi:hypothetical protein